MINAKWNKTLYWDIHNLLKKNCRTTNTASMSKINNDGKYCVKYKYNIGSYKLIKREILNYFIYHKINCIILTKEEYAQCKKIEKKCIDEKKLQKDINNMIKCFDNCYEHLVEIKEKYGS